MGKGGKGKSTPPWKSKISPVQQSIGKGKKGNNELTAFVRGLPFSITEEVLRKDFAECGEVVKLRMPLNEEGRPKGIAFIEFSNEEGLKKAIEYDNQEYGGRTINVAKAGDGPSKKDGDKGKGKGKDGKDKGKGKGKKGKKGGLSEEKKAAKDGAMVESTGEKKTFGSDDDDSDDEPPAKKKKVEAKPKAKPKPAEDSDDSSE